MPHEGRVVEGRLLGTGGCSGGGSMLLLLLLLRRHTG
jgi:hypothetical protein